PISRIRRRTSRPSPTSRRPRTFGFVAGATSARSAAPSSAPDREEGDVRENTLRTIWARGEAVVRGWLSTPSAFCAEVMAHQGFGSLTVDMQHGVVDYQVAVTMLQAVSTTPVIPLARVPWNDPARLMKILDAGVYGVICPMISTRAQAEALVAACKYPPRGYRSFGPVRASLYAGSDYGDRADDDIVVMPMIETAEALKNLDAILSVPGVGAIYVGPAGRPVGREGHGRARIHGDRRRPRGRGGFCRGRRARQARARSRAPRRHRPGRARRVPGRGGERARASARVARGAGLHAARPRRAPSHALEPPREEGAPGGVRVLVRVPSRPARVAGGPRGGPWLRLQDPGRGCRQQSRGRAPVDRGRQARPPVTDRHATRRRRPLQHGQRADDRLDRRARPDRPTERCRLRHRYLQAHHGARGREAPRGAPGVGEGRGGAALRGADAGAPGPAHRDAPTGAGGVRPRSVA